MSLRNFTAAVTASFMVAAPIAAQDAARESGVATLHAAERIVTAIKRAEMHACHITAGLNPQAPVLMQQEMDALEQNLDALRNGDSADGIEALRSPLVQQELDLLASELEMLRPYADYAQGGAFEASYLRAFSDAQQGVVAQAYRVVDAVSSTFMHGRVDLFESTTLDSIAKLVVQADLLDTELCMISVGMEEARTDLSHTMDEYQQRLSTMLSGDEMQRILPPSEVMAEALTCVQTQYDTLRPKLAQYQEVDAPDQVELTLISSDLHDLELQADRALALFEAELVGEAVATLDGCANPTVSAMN